MTSEPYEDPWVLRGRLKLGREEFCQRLLTTLILGGQYPRWNTRSRPPTSGEAFLRRLGERAGLGGWQPDPVFVDEFNLPARSTDLRGGAPDWAVLWPDRLWIIELKTEAASHRAGQMELYADLGAHHYPGADVQLAYITPPLRPGALAGHERLRVGHLLWSDVIPLIEAIWGDTQDPRATVIARHVCAVLLALDKPARSWRELIAPDSEEYAIRSAPSHDDMISRARLTHEDGRQRAIDYATGSLQELHDLRVELREALLADPDLATVQPWVWSAATSGGRALTASGEATGAELRLSRSRRPS